MSGNFVERRQHPRAVIDFKGVLETGDGERVMLRARNISASGVYFDAERRLMDFAEVSLLVALPAVGGGGPLAFECTGIIVRVEKNDHGDPAWPYSAAVHFTSIDDEHRQAIAAYVAAASG